MRRENLQVGVGLALICLMILAWMPIIASSRPAESSALSFAFFLSVWQLVFSLPLLAREIASPDKGIFGAALAPGLQRRTIAVVLGTGLMFALSTYVYVLAVERAGAVSAALAIQAYPLFAILWETLFLKRRKSALELAFTALLLAALSYLATGGTWRIDGLSIWFLLALAVPLLWSVAHVILKEVLDRTPVTPAQVTFFRVLISSVALGAVLIAVAGIDPVIADMIDPAFQTFALIMGLVYYIELIFWFYAVRYIDVSVASSITVPAPALTMVLAILFLDERVEPYQVAALAVAAAGLYGLIFAGARKARRQRLAQQATG